MRKKILIVEDDAKIRALYTQLFELLGEIEYAHNGKEGYDKAMAADYNLIVTDLSMPGMNGAQMAEALHREKPNLKFLVVSAFTMMGDLQETLKRIPTLVAVVSKPFKGDELRKLAMTALKEG